MKLCLIIAYILNIIDYIFTAHWVRKYGIEIEANPIGRWMFEKKIAWLFKIIIVGALLALIARYATAAWIAYIPLAVYSIIVLYHIALFLYLNK